MNALTARFVWLIFLSGLIILCFFTQACLRKDLNVLQMKQVKFQKCQSRSKVSCYT